MRNQQHLLHQLPSATLQPTCAVATGTITVTARIRTGITYGIDGSTYTNTTGIFTNVAAATYSVTARNAAGCISRLQLVSQLFLVITWEKSVLGIGWSMVFLL
jgi:hypothetical protein